MIGQTPRVAAVILNWRRPDDTLACVASVAAIDYPAIDIIVCDNDSQDGSYQAIDAGLDDALAGLNAGRTARGLSPFVRGSGHDAARMQLIQTGRNGGYAFGNNVGIAAALEARDVDYVWILNNDTLVDPAALTRLVATMQDDPTIGICGGIVMYQGDRERVQTVGGGRFRPGRARCEQIGTGLTRDTLPDPAQVQAELAYVNGAAALVSRRLIETVGPMDDGYFLYFEEIDWAERARAAGFRLGYCPDAFIYHQVGASAGTDDDGEASPTSTYHMERSKFRFFRRHHPAVLLVAVPVLAKAVATHWLKGRRRTARAMLAGALGWRLSG